MSYRRGLFGRVKVSFGRNIIVIVYSGRLVEGLNRVKGSNRGVLIYTSPVLWGASRPPVVLIYYF